MRSIQKGKSTNANQNANHTQHRPNHNYTEHTWYIDSSEIITKTSLYVWNSFIKFNIKVAKSENPGKRVPTVMV